MNRILKMEPNIPITNSVAIVATRNRIIHAYDAISDDIIWANWSITFPNSKKR